VPYSGTINWPSALVAFQKIGYDGAWMFELAASREPYPVLAAAAKARARFEALLNIGSEWGA
jgi:sugar phosphate isomerase/epimerase